MCISWSRCNICHAIFFQPTTKLVANSKAALPTIGDPITATQLANFAKSTATSLGELREAADKVMMRLILHFSGIVLKKCSN